jgi:hypothetical protein
VASRCSGRKRITVTAANFGDFGVKLIFEPIKLRIFSLGPRFLSLFSFGCFLVTGFGGDCGGFGKVFNWVSLEIRSDLDVYDKFHVWLLIKLRIGNWVCFNIVFGLRFFRSQTT